jgi:SAM-dependent methyltransferase
MSLTSPSRHSARRIAGPIELLSRLPPGAVLDIPAGSGTQAHALGAAGFRVVALDLFPPRDRERSSEWLAADASERLPFHDSAFDYVLSREGIEHLENQAGFIRECARVLRPGGRIVITTPNLMHLSSRVSQMLTSQRGLGRGLANEAQTLRGHWGGRYYHGHIFLIDYFRIRYLLRTANFDGIEVGSEGISPTSIALVWMAPLMYAASRWSIYRSARTARRKGSLQPPAQILTEIIGHVFSPALMFGKRMIVTAVRGADQRPA